MTTENTSVTARGDSTAPSADAMTRESTAASTLGVREAYESMGRASDKTDDRTRVAEAPTAPAVGDGPKRDTAETGLLSLAVGLENDSIATYDPAKRADRMTAHTRGTSLDGTEHSTRAFSGREDALTSERTASRGGTTETTRLYEEGRRTDGMISQWSTVGAGRNETTQEFRGRDDGMISQTVTRGADGERRTSVMEDGTSTVVATKPDGSQDTIRLGRDGKPETAPKARDTESENQSIKRLQEAADKHITNPEQRRKFMDSVTRFQERAGRSGVDSTEVVRTLDSVSNLLTGNGATDKALGADNRATLARQFMEHAANPKAIDQGRANTCTVTSMQEALTIAKPSIVADMLSQAALKGEYTAKDGTRIELDPRTLKPFGNSETYSHFNGDRSYATQVLNHVKANEITQRYGRPAFYSQRHEALAGGHTGESLTLESFNNDKPQNAVLGRDHKPVQHPNLYTAQIAEAMRRYTGEGGHVLMNAAVPGSNHPDITRFSTAEELASRLEERGGRPTIIAAEGRTLPGGSYDPNVPGHLMSLHRYASGSREVEFSNQWGFEKDGSMRVEQLFASTIPPRRTSR